MSLHFSIKKDEIIAISLSVDYMVKSSILNKEKKKIMSGQ